MDLNNQQRCLIDTGKTLVPPCKDMGCACLRAPELEGPTDKCVMDNCAEGELMGKFPYAVTSASCEGPLKRLRRAVVLGMRHVQTALQM